LNIDVLTMHTLCPIYHWHVRCLYRKTTY